MIRSPGRRPVAIAARLLRPYADMIRLGALLVRDGWGERDPDWLRRRGHRPALMASGVLFLSGALWPHIEAPAPVESVTESPTVILSLVEAAPAALGAISQQLQLVEPKRPDNFELADQRLRRLERRLDMSESERQRLEGEFQQLQNDVATRKRELAERERAMADMVAGQSAALDRLAEQTSASVEALSKLIARTGIDPEKLIAAVRREGGIGGPYVQFAENHYVARDILGASLGGPMLRLEALRSALTALPLETPLIDFTIMSGFGIRRDPFNGQAAMHAGVDLSAPSRSPVMSTAPGSVVVAGWQGEYGNMVEIDHGYGIRTRYAHLSRIDVKSGEVVGTRVQIGLLGSTGRSTGAHLHYEVIFDDGNLDPMRFIEAKRFVTRGSSARRAGRG